MSISIITPSYNQGAYIFDMIRSVKREAEKHTVEHIILDNCSADSTPLHLHNYQTSPGRVDLRVIVEPDSGQTAAINRGFSLATGDIVCWLNTDEWYHEGALSVVSQLFSENPDVDVIFGDCDYVKDGIVVKRRREWGYSHGMLLLYGCYIPSCATFVRRRVIEAGIVLDPTLSTVMDFDWYLAIAKRGYKFMHVSVPLASFTWHTNNISSVLFRRRAIERRMVQLKYLDIDPPPYLADSILFVAKWYWIFARHWLRLTQPRTY